MPGSETRKRQKAFSVRFNEQEAEAIKKMADRAGVSVASLIRHSLLNMPLTRATRHPTAGQIEIAHLIGQLGQLCDSIEDLKLITDDRLELDALSRDVSDVCIAAKQALGRKP